MKTKENKFACIEEVTWKGHKCIRFCAGGYESLMVPEVGANIIELKHNEKGLDLLRTPGENVNFETFKDRPQIYGIPVLFPPNRIEDGKFKLDDKEYKFPINEHKNNNFIHGLIKNHEWEIVRKEIIQEEQVEIEAVFNFDEGCKFYEYFPHKFQFRLIYNLSKDGLKQTTSVTNLSKETMPLAVGFHTAFNVPFHPESKEEDYRLIASIDKRWEQDNRNLPTGNILDLTENEKEYVTKGISPLGYKIESHYIVKNIDIDGKRFNGAIIEDTSKELRLVYEIGNDYKHMVVWNDMGDKRFVCVEPQTCVINAPNVNLDSNLTGFKTLFPTETWSEVCSIYVEDTKI